MRRTATSRFVARLMAMVFVAVAGLGVQGVGISRAHAHDASADKLPEPELRFRIIAPSARGPWLLRLDNESDTKLRIAADVRLLTFEVWAPADAKARKRGRGGWARKATVCSGPKTFGLTNRFPVARELVLEPGHSYTEEFDPRLICFAKDAELFVPGARVKARFGYAPNRRRRGKTREAAPFVADSASVPRKFRPMRRLEAPTMVLSHSPPVEYGVDEAKTTSEPSGQAPGPPTTPPEGGKPRLPLPPGEEGQRIAAGKEPPPKRPRSADEASRHRPRPPRMQPRAEPVAEDDLGARMTLTATHYADARRPTDIELSVQAHNAGERPLFVALRSRMLSFRVIGPDGLVRCRRPSEQHAVPRDLFRQLHHDKHVHMNVLLAEVCPQGTFDRPGLYFAIPRLYADADGRQYGLSAMTGVVTTRDPGDPSGTHAVDDDATLIRVTHGRRPFYRGAPRQLPTRLLPQ
jgi:hypothetical protein